MGSGLVRWGAGTALAMVLAGVLALPATADPTAPLPTDGTPVPADTGGQPGAPPSTQAPVPDPSPTVPAPTSIPVPAKPSLPAADHAPSDSAAQDGLNAEVLAQQLAAADRIWSSLTVANADLAAAMQRLDAVSAKVNVLLEKISTARDVQAVAESEAATARSQLTVVQVRLANAHAMVRLWALEAYAGNGRTGDLASVFDIMTQDPSQAVSAASDLSFVTDSRLRAMQDLAELEADQARLSATADAARARATQATTTLEAARAEIEPLLATQQSEVSTLRAKQLEEIAKAGPVAAVLLGAQAPEAKAAAARLRAALTAAQGTAAYSAGPPCSSDNATYPNGALPSSALCPLWGAPAQQLRPRAAAAFEAMSKDYARTFGTPLCVTDSYRTLADQVLVKATRGVWAATPGTSKHGLGVAVDLCGGVETFGSSQHLWMAMNAPLYGWYHPSWAEPTGSLPEPWHWEYAG